MTDYIKPGDYVTISGLDEQLDKETWQVQDTKLFPKILVMNDKYPPLICNSSDIQKLAVAV